MSIKITEQSLEYAAGRALVAQVVAALTFSGTTAQRPTKFLWAGRPYFDTSLGAAGKPIWRNKDNTGWIDATGAAV